MADAISLIIDMDDDEDTGEGLGETAVNSAVSCDIKDIKNNCQEDTQKPHKASKKNGPGISIAPIKKSNLNDIYNSSTGSTCSTGSQCNIEVLPFTRDVQLSDPADVLRRIIEVDAILDVVMWNFDFKASVDQSRAMSFFNKCTSYRQKNTSATDNSDETEKNEKTEKKEGFLEKELCSHNKKASHQESKTDGRNGFFEKKSEKNLFFEKFDTISTTNVVGEDESEKSCKNNEDCFYDFDKKDSENKVLSVYEIESKFGFLHHYLQYINFIKNSMKKKLEDLTCSGWEEESVKKLLESPAFIDMIVAEGNRLSLYFENLEFLKKASDGGSQLNNSLYLFFMSRFG